MTATRLDTALHSERFANLIIGKLHLLIPQTDVYSLEPALDMKPVITQPGSVGQLEQGGKVWPLYALSEDLELIDGDAMRRDAMHRVSTYHIAILMKHIEPHYGLLCEQVYALERSAILIYPIPPAMDTKDSPLLALALYGEEVRCISSAEALRKIL